ncbi:MAG: 4Fe-4S binding protein [Caldilineaceae bacterium]|nr:4Fe-4S binding protein [Caldilineaceae bacterium]
MCDIPLPIIDDSLCTGCGICIALCPTAALALDDERAVLARPDRCTYCQACEDICPEGAIALPFLIVFASRTSPGSESIDRPYR